jgi:hypothetical protein
LMAIPVSMPSVSSIALVRSSSNFPIAGKSDFVASLMRIWLISIGHWDFELCLTFGFLGFSLIVIASPDLSGRGNLFD